jgi:hypothetical protein
MASAGLALYGVKLTVPLWRAAPGWDEWALVLFYRDWVENTVGFRDLLAQHHEHRIPFTRLLFLIDFHFFRGQNVFAHWVNLVSYLGIGAALGLVASRQAPDRAERLLIVAFAVALALAPIQIANLVYAFQLQMSLVCLFALTAFFATARLSSPIGPRGYWAYAALAGVSAICAAYSSANGVIATAMTLILAWVLPIGWPARLTITAAAALALAGFFHGFQFLEHSQTLPFTSFGDATANLAQFVLAFLGSLLQKRGLEAAVGLGIAGAAAWIAAGVWSIVRWRRGTLDPSVIALMALATFALATAVMIGIARGSHGPRQALFTRYATFGVVFFASLVGLAWRAAGLTAESCRRKIVVSAVGAALLLQAYRLPGEYQYLAWLAGHIDVATAELRAGRFDPEHVKYLYQTPEFVRPHIEFLRAHRLSFFAD